MLNIKRKKIIVHVYDVTAIYEYTSTMYTCSDLNPNIYLA